MPPESATLIHSHSTFAAATLPGQNSIVAPGQNSTVANTVTATKPRIDGSETSTGTGMAKAVEAVASDRIAKLM